MQAAVIESLDRPPRYASFREPAIEEDELLVQVRAAGLHPIVKALARGSHYASGGELPAVAGIDGVGDLKDGTRVYFGSMRRPWGTMAEWAPAPRALSIPVPDELGDVEAAALVNPAMSSWVALRDRAALASGETVLILGATGVAGQLAIQVARHLGARRVIAAGRNVDVLAGADVDRIVALGEPEEAIAEALAAEAAAGIDVAIDYLWGRPTELLLEALAKGFNARSTHRTRLVEVGESAGKTITLPGATLRSIDLMLMGSGFGAASIDRILAAIPELFRLAARGRLTMEIEPVPLSEVESAWERVEKGRRIVFTI